MTTKKCQTSKLSDCVELFSGYAFKSSKYTNKSDDVPLVKGENVSQGRILWDKSKMWPKQELEYYKKFKLRSGDVIIAMDRPWVPSGLKWAHIRDDDPQSLLVQRCCCLRTKTEKVDQDYLKYIIGSNDFENYIKPITTGVNVPHISGKQILDFEFILPTITSQKIIIETISAYDDLIYNNEKRIKTLEEMAQLLFTEWFVKFKFPGHEKVKMINSETEYGMIPEGWEVNNVESLIKRIPVGKKYDHSNVYKIGDIPVLDQGKSGYIGYHNDLPGVKASIDNPVIVFANHTCYQNIITYPFSAIQNVLPFIPNDEKNIFWLHWATKDLIKLNDYKGHWPEFMSKKLTIPPIGLTNKFGETVKTMETIKCKLELINENLIAARDLLIPQLVTGKRELRDQI